MMVLATGVKEATADNILPLSGGYCCGALIYPGNLMSLVSVCHTCISEWLNLQIMLLKYQENQ
jgi:hypothetical protein